VDGGVDDVASIPVEVGVFLVSKLPNEVAACVLVEAASSDTEEGGLDSEVWNELDGTKACSEAAELTASEESSSAVNSIDTASSSVDGFLEGIVPAEARAFGPLLIKGDSVDVDG
jgi:hypothetical protein